MRESLWRGDGSTWYEGAVEQVNCHLIVEHYNLAYQSYAILLHLEF